MLCLVSVKLLAYAFLLWVGYCNGGSQFYRKRRNTWFLFLSIFQNLFFPSCFATGFTYLQSLELEWKGLTISTVFESPFTYDSFSWFDYQVLMVLNSVWMTALGLVILAISSGNKILPVTDVIRLFILGAAIAKYMYWGFIWNPTRKSRYFACAWAL